jgi:hypothetical protein
MAHECGEPEKTLVLMCDSSASRAILQRIGAGKCRHIQTRWLWIQQSLNEGELTTRAVKTDDNIADIATKPLAKERVDHLLKRMNIMTSLPAVFLGCLTRPRRAVIVLGMAVEVAAHRDRYDEHGQAAEYWFVVSTLFAVAIVIALWEYLKRATGHWTKSSLQAAGLRTRLIMKEQTHEKPKTRDVGVQSQCTYKWSWSSPRFVVLGEDLTRVTF